ncbi:hypothetical protein GC194_14350 [bacterium]|nr:hypothetical protein [bacterium]
MANNKKTILEAVMQSRKWQIGLLLGISIFIYLDTLNFNYALDDALYITDNSFTKKGFGGIKEQLLNESLVGFYKTQKSLLTGGRYRPLAPITYCIEYEFFGFNPRVSHLINILLYASLLLLIYHVFLIFFPGKNTLPIWLFCGLLLYATHPLHLEVVANIKGRDQILSLISGFLTLWFFAKFIKNKPIMIILAAISFFLGLLAKESTITFLPLIPLAFFFFYHEKVSTKKYAIISITLLVPTACWFFLRSRVLHGFETGVETTVLNNPFLYLSTSEKYGTILYTWLLYFKLHFIPFPLTHDYYPFQIPVKEISNFWSVLSLILYLFVFVLGIIGLARKKPFAFWIIYFGATFSISSNLFFNIGTFMNERFVFEASLAICIGLGYYLFKQIKKVQYALAISLVVLLVFSGLSFNRTFAWKDNFTLFTTDVNTSDNSVKCLVAAGGMYYEKAKETGNKTEKNSLLEQSIKLLQKAVQLLPSHETGQLLLANAYMEKSGPNDLTAQHYISVLKQNPANEMVSNNVISILNDKKYEVAKRLEFGFKFEKYLGENPAYNYLIGTLYCRELNNLDDGIVFLQKAYEIDHQYIDALKDLGTAYAIKGMYKESNEYLLKAHEIDKADKQIIQNIGLNYQNMGDMEIANTYFELLQNSPK